MEVVAQLRAMGPVNLAEIPLDSVSDHGIAHYARYSHTEYSSLTFPPASMQHEIAAHHLLPVFVEKEKILPTGEAFVGGKFLVARHKRLIIYVLDRKTYTVRRLRPRARRRRITARPPGVAMRDRNPWSRFRLIFDG